MAAPTPTARATPTGRMLGDGYQTLVALASDTNIEFSEVTVTPPGIEGDEPNDTTTMHNVAWRTMAPRTLAKMTDTTVTANYDPSVYNAILAIINRVTTVTIHFPDGSSLAFYGFVKNFQPGELAEGSKPTCTLTIVATNQDPVACTEEDPVYTAGTGTSPTC